MGADEYLEKARALLKRAEGFRDRIDVKCRDCRHYRYDWISPVCKHPVVVLAGYEQTDAYDRKRIQRCAEQRDSSSLYGTVVCGPDGALFEPK